MKLPKKDLVTGEEIPVDENFSYDGYQIVRGEFFSHMNEPSVVFNGNKFGVNMACLKRMPEVEYIQVLVKEQQRKLIIQPCSEDEKEAFVWCTLGEKKKPKKVTCPIFCGKINKLTGWDMHHRYKILGKMFRKGEVPMFIFDLDSAQEFPRTVTDDGKYKIARTPVFPAEWEKMFGPTVEEHRKQMEARVFKDYTVFSVVEKKPTPQEEENS